jgi:hypothetical protein
MEEILKLLDEGNNTFAKNLMEENGQEENQTHCIRTSQRGRQKTKKCLFA